MRFTLIFKLMQMHVPEDGTYYMYLCIATDVHMIIFGICIYSLLPLPQYLPS